MTPGTYEALFHQSPNAYFICSRDYTLVDVNEALARMVGRSRDELVGANLFEAFPDDPEGANPDQTQQLKASIDRVFQSGKPDVLALLRYSIPLSAAEGSGFRDELWSVSHHPLLGADGQVVLAFQHTQNISDLRETLLEAFDEADAGDGPGDTADRQRLGGDIIRNAASVQARNRALDNERKRLISLFDQSLSFTVFMREPEHIVELANPAYLTMVGETDLRDRGYGSGHRGEPPVPIRLLDAVYESGVPIIERGLALRVPHDGGQTRVVYVDVVIQQIVDAAGKVIGVFMQGNDVTQSKAAQDELDAYRTRLEDLVAERTRALERSEAERRNAEVALQRAQRLESIGKLTGGVAHDFNNVLQIIRGNLQLLQKSVRTDAQAAARLDAAIDGVERGAKLASQLLAFGRRQVLEPVVVDLEQVLRRMEDLLHRALGESIDIRTHVSAGLWHTLVDLPRLENVILNIAINARDAMEHRGKLTMELTNASVDAGDATAYEGILAGDYVVLAISDTGHGMSAEVQRRAFEPFFTTKPEGEGTGLGLAMVYGFVKQSGGHVTLYSEEGHGTTFRLYLPRSLGTPADIAVSTPSASMRGAGETILVVEDDEAVRITVVDTLADLGYRVLFATDGESALAIVQGGAEIDLLFTDVVMPGPVSSVAMVEQARALLPRLLVLHTSGFTNDAIVHGDRLDAGVNLLSKPYSREDLARKLRQMLDERTDGSAAMNSRPGIEPDTGTRSKGPARILVVEDSDYVREMTVEFIGELGHEVVAVESAEVALETLEASRFDIVFTDVSLPGMSGVALLKIAREARPDQRFVIASGYGADLDGRDFGSGVAVLPKPYDLARLENVLDTILAGPSGPQAS